MVVTTRSRAIEPLQSGLPPPTRRTGSRGGGAIGAGAGEVEGEGEGGAGAGGRRRRNRTRGRATIRPRTISGGGNEPGRQRQGGEEEEEEEEEEGEEEGEEEEEVAVVEEEQEETHHPYRSSTQTTTTTTTTTASSSSSTSTSTKNDPKITHQSSFPLPSLELPSSSPSLDFIIPALESLRTRSIEPDRDQEMQARRSATTQKEIDRRSVNPSPRSEIIPSTMAHPARHHPPSPPIRLKPVSIDSLDRLRSSTTIHLDPNTHEHFNRPSKLPSPSSNPIDHSSLPPSSHRDPQHRSITDPTQVDHHHEPSSFNSTRSPNLPNASSKPSPSSLQANPAAKPPPPSSPISSFSSPPPPASRSSSPQPPPQRQHPDRPSEPSTTWSIIDRLRLWRDDARAQHLYQTAAFWGSKVYNITCNPNDAFWLAQVFFLTGQFFRAEKILTSAKRIHHHPDRASSEEADPELPPDDPSQHPSTLEPSLDHRQTSHDFSFWEDLLPDSNRSYHDQDNEQPGHNSFGRTRDDDHHSTILVRMTDYSTACRYLAAQCMIRQGKWDAALEMVGDENPFRFNPAPRTTTTTRMTEKNRSALSPSASSTFAMAGGLVSNDAPMTTTSENRRSSKKTHVQRESSKAATDGPIKFESSMCYLRGLIHLHKKSLDRAKECFLESLALDVKCYESFEALVGGNMLEPEEEWEFIQSLEYNSQTPEDSMFIKSLYTIRLKKFNHKQEIFDALKILKDDYRLSDDPDTAFGLADWLFTHYRFIDCYRITSRILKLHYHHLPSLPLHLTCMTMIKKLLPSLFLLAHQLIERDPNSPISWYAAGLWYFSQKRWEESRRFFSKAALLDSRFPETWFAFGHALAYEGEHDQAITAYSTASHNFQGSHLPLLFIGMQHIQLANPLLALDYLSTAADICPFDPLVMHERGVVCYYQEQWHEAIEFFLKTLELVNETQTDPSIWAPIHLNLGHCYRRLKRHSESLQSIENARALLPRSPSILTALGMAQLGLGLNLDAIKSFHDSLAILPADPMTTTLLQFGLDLETTSEEVDPRRTTTSRFHRLMSFPPGSKDGVMDEGDPNWLDRRGLGHLDNPHLRFDPIDRMDDDVS